MKTHNGNIEVSSNESRFIFRDIEYNSGDKVMVSGHYACYKSQYNFMVGVVYIDKSGTPRVKLEINPDDIRQTNDIQLSCYENITKI